MTILPRSPARAALAVLCALFAQLATPAGSRADELPRSAAKPVEGRPSAAAIEHFEKHVRPLLVNNCHGCHSAETNSQGGLRVDDRNGLIHGGNGGPAVVPGHPEQSRLILAVSYADKKLQMPPKKRLTDEEVAILTRWIADGAAWPTVEVPADLGTYEQYYKTLRASHWAWQPVKPTPAPEVRDAAWPRSEIDRFVLAGLEAKGLSPVADADRVALLRRVSFDLTGLPPTPEEIDAFANDDSPRAFEAVVDRLLASRGFGERWGRHWLDVARYGESTGSSRNLPYPHAWRYRDYVIASFNADKPYDRFLTEQIAGDLLPAETQAERDELTVATGFLALGVKDVNQRFKVRFVMDNIDEQIDTVTRAVLALTASCARCHDHKFDPIPATDYYALAGIFQSTDICIGLRNKMGGGGLDYYDTSLLLPLGGERAADPEAAAKIEATKQALAEARSELVAIRDDPDKSKGGAENEEKLKAARQKVNKIQAELVSLSDPANLGPIAAGVRDARTIADTGIRIRGEAEKIGPVVPRGFLSAIAFEGQPQVNPQQSGRLELARWLAGEKNPLTARVMVNRVWQHLFGEGLVSTVDNFGTTGDVPSHPELLDHLATRFTNDGWSVKRLVRALVLSRAYQLSANTQEAAAAIDPANRLVWRHGPRRLDAEELRDAMLAASGQLDLSPLEGSPAGLMKVIELNNDGAEAKRMEQAARASVRRSVYLPLVRGVTPTSLAVFDFAEQGMVTGRRDVTTVAPQALYLMNDPFTRERAQALAARILASAETDDGERLIRAHRHVLGRSPTTAEAARAASYLREYEVAAKEIAEPSSGATEDQPLTVASTGDETDSSNNTTKSPLPKRNAAPPLNPRLAAWTSYCQALFGSAEFRYLR